LDYVKQDPRTRENVILACESIIEIECSEVKSDFEMKPKVEVFQVKNNPQKQEEAKINV